jgi:glycosyltransferase involved in cell wall biosynthesis
MDKVISFIQPSRNNLKYLKWSYNSIRKHLGYRHEICWADDFSDDGTWEWMNEIKDKDLNVKIHRNEGPERLGHTILYDTLVEMATNDIVMIFHADMYACPKLDEMVLKHLEPGKVVSATRIEPPLHPAGPEKVLEDFGIEPEEFKEQELLKEVTTLQLMHGTDYNFAKFTEGIFAPWAIYKEDFQRIGGHDPLYAPQSKEDSDIFNRFVLAGYELIQTWEGFVYHMSCRGSRFKDGAKRNPDGQVFMKGRESDEWLKQNRRSTRNFVRKWGHFVMHDEMMYPIIPPKYDVAFSIYNCTPELMAALEPWCSVIYSDVDPNDVDSYIKVEQPNTLYDLTERVRYITEDKDSDVVIELDGSQWKDEHSGFINNLTQILKDSGEVGTMDYEIFTLYIEKLETYEKELIKL